MTNDVILTGMPRGGTSLIAALIDSLPDAVALNEPLWHFDWMVRNAATSHARDFAHWVVDDFGTTRQKLVRCVPIAERRGSGGEAVTNYYRENSHSKRIASTTERVDFIRPNLSPDFTLAIKHNAPYLAVLNELAEVGAIPIIAIVRHPVGVISSWKETPIPMSNGRMPGAKFYWDEMRVLSDSSMNLDEKLIRMYDLICKRLYDSSSQVHVIRYEDLVEDPLILFRLIGKEHVTPLRHVEVSERTLDFYEGADELRTQIQRSGEFYRAFYPDL